MPNIHIHSDVKAGVKTELNPGHKELHHTSVLTVN